MTDADERLWSMGLEVVRRLQERGFEAYLVGGCARDRLLGRPLHDVDVATSALPDQVAASFERVIPTGLQHGTVTVMHEGTPFEVTTYRTESGYSDARRPDSVAFVRDIREDLARRDFTINAMAAGLEGEWIDPYGGREDLSACIVRCVGDADRRFGEDALRMVRAIRFAAAFRFRMAKSVWRGIRSQAPRLRFVAMERIGAEWDKMMAGADPDRACRLLARSGLLAHLKEPLPEVLTAGILAYRTAAESGPKLRDIADTDARWIAWLSRCGAEREEAIRFCRTIRLSGKREARIGQGVAFARRMAGSPDDKETFIPAVLDYGKPAASDWLAAVGAGSSNGHAALLKCLEELPADSVRQLAVRGDELARHGNRQAGPWVAKALRSLLEEVAFGRLPNDHDALLQAAEAFKDS